MIVWNKIKKFIRGVLPPLFRKMNDEQELQFALHNLNVASNEFNKNMVQKSATMGDVPINRKIYEEAAAREATRQQMIQQQAAPQPLTQAPQQPMPPQQPAPVVQQQDLTPLIDRVTALEKQVTKFVNLIERNVAKNAKEINIRIKLNENNDSKD